MDNNFHFWTDEQTLKKNTRRKDNANYSKHFVHGKILNVMLVITSILYSVNSDYNAS